MSPPFYIFVGVPRRLYTTTMELIQISECTQTYVTSLLSICWSAQADLYYHYGIDKYELPKKCSGIYKHSLSDPTVKLVRGFYDVFRAPHSRYPAVAMEDIKNH